MNIYKKKSGYTLLFAVLIATLVLGVATFIANMVRSQYILSSTARNSMFSFNAAGSGVDCILEAYKLNPSVLNGPVPATNTVSCANQSNQVTWALKSGTTYEFTTTFGFSRDGQNPQLAASSLWGCALMTIDTDFELIDDSDPMNPIYNPSNISIVAKGYNLCTRTGVSPNVVFSPTASAVTVERQSKTGWY